MKQLIISFISTDRPGLVDTLSNIVKQYQGNWQASSLHYLSGFFAGVVEISVLEQQCEPLIAALTAVQGLSIISKVADENIIPQHASFVLELTANDRAGIVQEISSVIHRQGGNLLKLVSKRESAAHSGHELFKAKVTVSVDENHIDDLVDAIEHLADDLMVDISRK